MQEEKTNQNPETKEELEQKEDLDDYLVTVDDLVTEIDIIDGKPSMTLVGICSLANKEGISVETLEWHENENDIVVIVSTNYKDTNRYASASEKKNVKFAWSKAFSKAQRNLFKICLYGHPAVLEAYDEFEKRGGKQTYKNQNKPANPQTQENLLSFSRNQAIKLWKNSQKELSKLGITQEAFQAAVLKRYNVESKDKMTVANYKNLITSLNNINSVEWIKEIAQNQTQEENQDPTPEQTEAPTENKEGV